MTRKPIVGITSYRMELSWGSVWQGTAAFLPQQYLDFVTEAGGVPVILPPLASGAETVVAGMDALIVSGGPDVSPARYGEQPIVGAEGSDVVRDDWEFAVLEQAVRRGLPVLAICRGLQVLNVLYGGTLHQHLPDATGTHEHRIAVGTFHRNVVTAVPGTPIEAIVGPTTEVMCHHHQAIDALAPGLVAGAHAGDGVVEAAYDPERPFVVGVQWHPEEGSDRALTAALVDAASQQLKVG